MTGLRSILKALAGELTSGRSAVLATLVAVEGSAYRRPGARMLVMAGGRSVGSISGGCLDLELCRQAEALAHDAGPVVASFNTRGKDDELFGSASACGGALHILLERIRPGSVPVQLEWLEECMAQRRGGVLATVYGVEGASALAPGDCVMLRGPEAQMQGTWTADLAGAAMEAAEQVQAEGCTSNRAVRSPSGRVQLLCEVVQLPIHLVIFGAGDSAMLLARLGRELEWRVTVADRRSELATEERFPGAHSIVAMPLVETAQWLQVDARTAAVIMTHHYADDLLLLKTLLSLPVPYVGLLGAHARTKRLLHDLTADGFDLAELGLERLHGPVGLDIGAEAPEEVALAIVAEVQAVLAGRAGGMLRNRAGSIHLPSAGSDPAK